MVNFKSIKRTFWIVLIGMISATSQLYAQDLISGGPNQWILHTPDDGRTGMWVAPYTNGQYDWANSTTYYNNGNVLFRGNVVSTNQVVSREVLVTNTPTADFVFEPDYKNPSLEHVESFIKANQHLPGIASAKAMKRDGVNLGAFQIQLLQKIEEMTLHMIDQQKRIKALEQRLEHYEGQHNK